MIKKYLMEVWHLKIFVIVVIAVTALSYSVYYFFEPAVVADLGDEDKFFEWWTAISLFMSSFICFYLFIRSKNVFFILLALAFFFGGGEEISWGQRIFGFKTPELLDEVNAQHEFSFHNIEIFNSSDRNGNMKHGFARLLEVNFLFRLFMMVYGIVLPFVVFHVKLIRKFTEKIKMPIPPIGIGIFFFINWFIFRILHVYVLSSQYGLQYLDSASEIFECVGAFILLIVSIYFLTDRKKIVFGQDIKNYLFS